jgi:hypothetical protein
MFRRFGLRPQTIIPASVPFSYLAAALLEKAAAKRKG